MISSATLLDGNLSVQVRLIFWGKPMQHSKPKKESFQLHSHLLRCISVSIQATTTSFAKSKSANLTRPSESTGIPLLDSSPLFNVASLRVVNRSLCFTVSMVSLLFPFLSIARSVFLLRETAVSSAFYVTELCFLN